MVDRCALVVRLRLGQRLQPSAWAQTRANTLGSAKPTWCGAGHERVWAVVGVAHDVLEGLIYLQS